MHWEYVSETCVTDDLGDLLSRYSGTDWELVGLAYSTVKGWLVLVFKRPFN